MKPKLLSLIEDIYYIELRGCVIFPGIPASSPFAVIVGTPIELRLPDGKIIQTHIEGIEMICRRDPSTLLQSIPILFPREITREDLPAGTEVWLLKPKLHSVRKPNKNVQATSLRSEPDV